MYSNGVKTGKCIPSVSGTTPYTCEIFSWCPLEVRVWPLKDKTRGLLEATENFTVLIKNVVSFPKFGYVIRRNIKHLRDNVTIDYLLHCMYDPVLHKGCPRFKLGDIARLANTNYKDMVANGGIIVISIRWDCNLDYAVDTCFPTYSFYRGDSPRNKMFSGWHFKYAHYYDNGRRSLYTLYGIKYIFNVNGHAGKFDIKPLLQHIGAGLSLLAIQVIICDILVLYVIRARKYYQKVKYEDINEPPENTNTGTGRAESRPSTVKRRSTLTK